MDFTINSLQLCPQLGVCSAAQPSGEATIPDRHPVTVPQLMYVYVHACWYALICLHFACNTPPHTQPRSASLFPKAANVHIIFSIAGWLLCELFIFANLSLGVSVCVFAYLPSNQSTAVLPTTGWNLKLQKWKKRAMSENRIAKLWQRILSFWQCACNTNNNEWRPSDFASLNGVNGFSVNIVTQLTGCQLQAASS